jgi:hypothetical protein
MVSRLSRTDGRGESGGQLKVRALRGGTVSEVSGFLSDMDDAYRALYSLSMMHLGSSPDLFERFLFDGPYPPRRMMEYLFRSGFSRSFESDSKSLATEQIEPEYRLEIRRVLIQSPGFWEFVGGLNPLQQLREFLNDRHERRKDQEYREQSEKDRLRLDNEILEQTLVKQKLENAREQFSMMREFGPYEIDERELKQIIWQKVGPSISKLGQHQDTKLIEGAGENLIEKA